MKQLRYFVIIEIVGTNANISDRILLSTAVTVVGLRTYGSFFVTKFILSTARYFQSNVKLKLTNFLFLNLLKLKSAFFLMSLFEPLVCLGGTNWMSSNHE